MSIKPHKVVKNKNHSHQGLVPPSGLLLVASYGPRGEVWAWGGPLSPPVLSQLLLSSLTLALLGTHCQSWAMALPSIQWHPLPCPLLKTLLLPSPRPSRGLSLATTSCLAFLWEAVLTPYRALLSSSVHFAASLSSPPAPSLGMTSTSLLTLCHCGP